MRGNGIFGNINTDPRIYTSTSTARLLLCTEWYPRVCIILSSLFISVCCGNAGDRISGRGGCKEGSSWGVSVSLGLPRIFPLGGQRCVCVTKRNNGSSSQNLCAHDEIPLFLLSSGRAWRCSQDFEGCSLQGKCVYFSAERKGNSSHWASLPRFSCSSG